MVHKKAVKAFADNAFGVCWTQQALQYLNTVLHFHIVRIVDTLDRRLRQASKTRDENVTPSVLGVLKSVLCEYE